MKPVAKYRGAQGRPETDYMRVKRALENFLKSRGVSNVVRSGAFSATSGTLELERVYQLLWPNWTAKIYHEEFHHGRNRFSLPTGSNSLWRIGKLDRGKIMQNNT